MSELKNMSDFVKKRALYCFFEQDVREVSGYAAAGVKATQGVVVNDDARLFDGAVGSGDDLRTSTRDISSLQGYHHMNQLGVRDEGFICVRVSWSVFENKRVSFRE